MGAGRTYDIFQSLQVALILGNSAHSDEMQGYAAFFWVFPVCQRIGLWFSSIQRFNLLGRNVKTLNFLTGTFYL